MQYSFQTKPSASATITIAGTANTVKISGINGLQTNAENFSTALTDFFDIADYVFADSQSQRTITQQVKVEN